MATARRFKINLRTPELDYWSEPIAASGMYAALRLWADRVTDLPPTARPGGAQADRFVANRTPGWHLSVVPEESWPALERERELILGDAPF